MSTPEPLALFKGHARNVWRVDANENYVVSGSADSSVRIWDRHTAKCLRVCKGHSAWVYALHIAPGGVVASGALDRKIILWDIESGKQIRTLKAPSGVISLATQGDNDTLFAGHGGGEITMWHLPSGNLLHTFKGHTDYVRGLAVSGDYVVSSSDDSDVRVWSISQKRELYSVKEHKEWATGVAITEDGTRFVSVSRDNTYRVHDLRSGALIKSHKENIRTTGYFSVVLRRNLMMMGTLSGALVAYDFSSGDMVADIKKVADSGVAGLCLYGNQVLTSSSEPTFKMFQLTPDEMKLANSPQTTQSQPEKKPTFFNKLFGTTKPKPTPKPTPKPEPIDYFPPSSATTAPLVTSQTVAQIPAGPLSSWTAKQVQAWGKTLSKDFNPIFQFLHRIDADGDAVADLTLEDVKDNTSLSNFVAKMFMKKLEAVKSTNGGSEEKSPVNAPTSAVPPSSSSGAIAGGGGGGSGTSHFARRTLDEAGSSGAELDDRLTPFFGVREAKLMSITDAVESILASEESLLQIPDLRARASWALERMEKRQRKYVKRLRKQGHTGMADAAAASGLDVHGLSVHHAAALNLYTQSGEKPLYSVINKLMRERSRKLAIPAFPYMRLLMEAIEKLPLHKEPIWRGVALNLLQQYEDEEDEQIMWWQFSSCTTDLKLLQDNSQFLGTSGKRTLFMVQPLHAVSIAEYSDFPEEAEVLLPPARLEVVSAMNQGNNCSLVQLKEVKQGKNKLIQ